MYLPANFVLRETDLASRHSAAQLRPSIEEALLAGPVELDFSNVVNVSESFADELFGVLVRDLGPERVFAGLRVRRASPDVLHSIVSAIRLRLAASKQSGAEQLALLAARKELEKRAQVASRTNRR